MIIDGPFLAHKSYHAPYRLFTSTGLGATMLNSFIQTMIALRKKYTPYKFIVAWESHGTVSWRKELYSSYKSESHGKTKVFWDNIKDIQIFLYLLGVEQFYSPCNEADDVIATLVNNGYKKSLIYTIDKDMMQLINDDCQLCSTKEIINDKSVKGKFFIQPHQIPDFLAIWGDKTDGIEGINGYGIKKSAKVIEKYGCIENISPNDTLSKYLSRITLNKKLTTLNKSCSLHPIPNKNFKTNETLETILDKYELERMKSNLNEIKLIGSSIDMWLR